MLVSEHQRGEPTPVQVENRGLAWLIGAFVICPCHLPLTLALLGMLVSGTAAATVLNDHLSLAGGVIVFVWLAATLRGVVLVRSARLLGNALVTRQRYALLPRD